jgi:hypothetical protein
MIDIRIRMLLLGYDRVLLMKFSEGADSVSCGCGYIAVYRWHKNNSLKIGVIISLTTDQ